MRPMKFAIALAAGLAPFSSFGQAAIPLPAKLSGDQINRAVTTFTDALREHQTQLTSGALSTTPPPLLKGYGP